MQKKDIPRYLSLIDILNLIGRDKNKFGALINSLDEKSIKFLCECVKNGISKTHVSNLPSGKKSFLLKIITPHKKLLKKICQKSKRYTHAKKQLIQKGSGFFIPLLSTLLPIITSLIKN